MEEEELEFVEELEAVLQLTPEVQLAIEQVSVPPPRERSVGDAAVLGGGSCAGGFGREEAVLKGAGGLGKQRWAWVSESREEKRPF